MTDMPMTLDEVQRLYERPAHVRSIDVGSVEELIASQKNQAASARTRAILDTALGVGVKAGLAWQLRNIDAAVHRRERDLDSIYDFGTLMVKQRVVPPVITEARDLYHQEGDYALRLSGAYYRIESQARFSSVAPSWREYLTFPAVTFDRADVLAGLLPRDKAEEQVWRIAVADGWTQGVEQANVMLEHGLDRMNRDLTGMIRFHEFVLQGKVSLPAIASENMPVTQEGATMAVDETLLRITTLPEFVGSVSAWRSAVTTSLEGPLPGPASEPTP